MRARLVVVALVAIVALVAVTGCTPVQIAAWHQWHADDPEAAVAFLDEPWVREELEHHRASPPRGDSPEQRQANTARANSGGGTVWDRLAQCESGGNWSINTGNGYYGGLQFGLTAWRAVGGSGRPDQASRAEQIRRAEILLDLQGWGAWPACSRRLGLR